MALIFVLFGAPDLAMTQFLVETLTVILFVLVFYHLPELPDRVRAGRPGGATPSSRWPPGPLMTALVLVGTPENFDPPISAYFAEHSVPRGHGRNIVNVILVDFRGLDTLGEITVLSVAAVGVYALLKLRRTDATRRSEAGARPKPEAAGERTAVTARPGRTSCSHPAHGDPLPAAAAAAVLRLPAAPRPPRTGRGFSGGLVAAAAFVLYRFAFGVEERRRALRVDPRTLIGAGLLVAIASGSAGLLGGRPVHDRPVVSSCRVPGVGDARPGDAAPVRRRRLPGGGRGHAVDHPAAGGGVTWRRSWRSSSAACTPPAST